MDSGESQWITGSHARADVQRLRAEAGAVMTGIGTVLADDPSLNVRAGALDTRGLQPLRVVLDRQLRMPLSAGMLALPGKTLICCTAPDGVSRDTQALQRAGAEVQEFRKFDGQVDADDVLAELATRGVNIVLVEAGPTLAGHLLQRNLVDELVIYQAPHIMGSRTIGLFETGAWSSLADRMPLTITDVRRVGQDTKITARPERRD